MSQVALVAVLLYAIIVKNFAKFQLGILFSAAVVVAVPFAFDITVRGIMAVGYGQHFLSAFRFYDFVNIILQFVAACGAFYYIDRYEENLPAWAAAVIAGVIIIFFAVPYFVSSLFFSL